MEHLAIMTKGYIEKILSGEKTIESRFSKNRSTPYNRIAPGDTVYLQEVGKEVTAVFKAGEVLFFDGLSEEAVGELRKRYGRAICAGDEFWSAKRSAKYATLIYITAPKAITPFRVYKSDRSAFKTVGSVRDELVVNRRAIVKHPHDCENGKHYFIFDGHTRCQFCGCGFLYGEAMRARPDLAAVKDMMKVSMWNDTWLNAELDNVAKGKLHKTDRRAIRAVLDRSIRTRRPNDGRQTPYYGSPVYYAQHGLGCCCRKCLEKFYGIPQDAVVSDDDMEYFTDLVWSFIQERA